MMIILPFIRYGAWNDLLVRGVVVYMWILYFLTMTFVFYAGKNVSKLRKIAVVVILLIGALTPIRAMKLSFDRYYMLRSPISAIEYPLKNQFLGNIDSFFFKNISSYIDF